MVGTQKITTHLWFNGNAEEAVEFYTSVFADSRITNVARWGEGGPGRRATSSTSPSSWRARPFIALNGGPQFTFSPAMSLFVSCESQAEVDELWDEAPGGRRQTQRVRVARRPLWRFLAGRAVGADRIDERSRPEGVRTRRAGHDAHAEDRHRQSAAGAPGRVAADHTEAPMKYMLMMNVPGGGPYQIAELACGGYRGTHRVHAGLRRETLRCRRAGRGRGSERAGPGEARASGRRRGTDHRRRVPGIERVPCRLLDRGCRHAGACLRRSRQKPPLLPARAASR